MRFQFSIYTLLIILLCINGCVNGRFVTSSPSRWEVVNNAPPGPEAFREGWKDGCQTQAAAIAGVFYSAKEYEFRLNYKLSKSNPDYNIGRTEAIWFCGRYLEKYVSSTNVLL